MAAYVTNAGRALYPNHAAVIERTVVVEDVRSGTVDAEQRVAPARRRQSWQFWRRPRVSDAAGPVYNVDAGGNVMVEDPRTGAVVAEEVPVRQHWGEFWRPRISAAPVYAVDTNGNVLAEDARTAAVVAEGVPVRRHWWEFWRPRYQPVLARQQFGRGSPLTERTIYPGRA